MPYLESCQARIRWLCFFNGDAQLLSSAPGPRIYPKYFPLVSIFILVQESTTSRIRFRNAAVLVAGHNGMNTILSIQLKAGYERIFLEDQTDCFSRLAVVACNDGGVIGEGSDNFVVVAQFSLQPE